MNSETIGLPDRVAKSQLVDLSLLALQFVGQRFDGINPIVGRFAKLVRVRPEIIWTSRNSLLIQPLLGLWLARKRFANVLAKNANL
jgi:hypothetical protein